MSRIDTPDLEPHLGRGGAAPDGDEVDAEAAPVQPPTPPSAWLGLLSTLVAAVPLAVGQLGGGATMVARPGLWWAIWLTFVVAFVAMLAERPGPGGRDIEPVLTVVMIVSGLAVVVVEPGYGLNIVLPIVAVTAATYAFGLRVGLGLVALQVAVVAAALTRRTSTSATDALVEAAAWGGFMGFAVLTVAIAEREATARRELEATNQRLAVANERLAEANERLEAAQELLEATSRTAERLRISRDLHDVLGHQLTALILQLEAAGHAATGDLTRRIDESREVARGLLNDVRVVVGQLRDDTVASPFGAMSRPGGDVDQGQAARHVPEVLAAVRAVTAVPAPPRIHVDARADAVPPRPDRAMAVVRIVQELVTNCVRHASAHELWIVVGRGDGATSISVRDDGRGVDVVVDGNGLRGLRERVAQAGGHVHIRSSPGAGFCVEVTLPDDDPCR